MKNCKTKIDYLPAKNTQFLIFVVIISGNVPLEWLNMSLNMFKIHCKKKFLIMQ